MRSKLCHCLAALLLATGAHAGPREDALATVQRWAKAFAEADVDGITSLYAPDAVMFGTQDKVLLTRTPEIRSYFERALLADRPRTANLRDHSVVMLSDYAAVVSGLDTLTATRDGKMMSANGRITFVLDKRPTGWQIVHVHRSPLPN